MDKRMDVDKHSVNMPSAPRHPIHKDPPPVDRNSYMEKVSELLMLKQQCPFSPLLQPALCSALWCRSSASPSPFLLLDFPIQDWTKLRD